MIEYCCLAILLVIVVFLLLTIIPRKHTYKYNQYTPNNHKKVDGKICIKCGNVSSVDSKFCNHCGKDF